MIANLEGNARPEGKQAPLKKIALEYVKVMDS